MVAEQEASQVEVVEMLVETAERQGTLSHEQALGC